MIKLIVGICFFTVLLGGFLVGSFWLGMSCGATFWEVLGIIGIALAANAVVFGIVALSAWLGS